MSYYKLNDGYQIPKVGFGSMRIKRDKILEAINAGYRQLDTATIYRNEEEVGAAIKASGIPREEFFVVTKLWNTDHKNAAKALDLSLEKLGLDYVDLYLMHWPFSEIEGTDHKVYDDWNYIDTYKEMQKIYKNTKKIRSLGVSNFTIDQFEKLFSDPEVDVVPVVDQIEAHPFLKQPELKKYLESKNILLQAFSPLGGQGNFAFNYDEIKELAKKYGVTEAQILNSWGVQRGTNVIPRSNDSQRIKDNLKLVTLSDEDFATINSLEEKYGTRRNGDPWRFE